MRSDESLTRRVHDREKLRAHLETLRAGDTIPIDEWYQRMDALGLGRSDRQRLSELRKEGYNIFYDRASKSYHYRGFGLGTLEQLELVEVTR